MSSKPRFYIEETLRNNISINCPPEMFHKIRDVLRLKSGDLIYCFNGVDGQWLAEYQAKGKNQGFVVMLEQSLPQPSPINITLVYAALKQARMEYMIQKAVEMGVTHLVPIISERTTGRHPNITKIKGYAIAAAQQCEIMHIPSIASPVKLFSWLDEQRADPSWSQILLADEAAELCDPTSALSGAPSTLDAHWQVVVGPEGGFSEKERQQFYELLNCWKVRLGPRIMRADTAMVAALSLLQSQLGDWKFKNSIQ